jgi:hypothetical protein
MLERYEINQASVTCLSALRVLTNTFNYMRVFLALGMIILIVLRQPTYIDRINQRTHAAKRRF